MISNFSILKKMLLVGFSALLALIVLSTLFLIDEKNVIIDEKKSKLINLVEIPFSLIEAEYKDFLAGKIDEDTAKKNALDAIKK